MDEFPAADELAGLRHFLKRLESGDMKLTVNGIDGMQHEIDILKHEIARLERVIARLNPAVRMPSYRIRTAAGDVRRRLLPAKHAA